MGWWPSTVRLYHHVIFWIILVCGIAATTYGLWQRESMRLERLVLVGPFHYLKPAEVQVVAQPFLRYTFWSLPLARLRAALQNELPWVASVRIARLWPPGLRIELTERQPVAFWGEYGLLTQDGRIFRPSAASWNALQKEHHDAWVHLSGPDDQAGALLAFYQQAQWHDTPAGHDVVAVRMNARHAWEVQLNNGAEVRLGRANIDQRWHRFEQVYGLWAHRRDISRLYFDFRYPNGFVLGRRMPQH